MDWESSGVVGFDLGPKTTYRKSWAGNLLMWSDLTLDPSFKVITGIAKLKSAYNLLIIGPRHLGW